MVVPSDGMDEAVAVPTLSALAVRERERQRGHRRSLPIFVLL
jgi:hypothetical protein